MEPDDTTLTIDVGNHKTKNPGKRADPSHNARSVPRAFSGLDILKFNPFR